MKKFKLTLRKLLNKNLTLEKLLKNIKCKINKNSTLKKLLQNIKCKINKNLTLKKSLKSSSKKSKKFNILSTYNIGNGKYKAWRFIFIQKRINKYN